MEVKMCGNPACDFLHALLFCAAIFEAFIFVVFLTDVSSTASH